MVIIMESIPYRVNGRFKLDNTEHTLCGGWHKQGLPSVKGFLRGHGSWPPSGPASLLLLQMHSFQCEFTDKSYQAPACHL